MPHEATTNLPRPLRHDRSKVNLSSARTAGLRVGAANFRLAGHVGTFSAL
jgi:hypothetical protein